MASTQLNNSSSQMTGEALEQEMKHREHVGLTWILYSYTLTFAFDLWWKQPAILNIYYMIVVVGTCAREHPFHLGLLLSS